MNINKILSMTLIGAASLVMMSSCNDDDTENRTTFMLPSFALVTDMQSNTSVYDATIKTDISIETFGSTADISVSGLNVEPGKELSFNTGDISMSLNKEGAYTATASGISASSSVIEDLRFMLYQRVSLGSITGVDYLVNTTFTVDNRWKVRIVDNNCRFYGYSVIRTVGTESTYRTAEPQYLVRFDPEKGTADLYVYNARFDSKMPQAFDMVFPGIPFSMVQNGYSLHADELIPRIGDVPYERYKITDLNVTGSFVDNSLTVSFTCAGRYALNATLGAVLKADK